MLAVLFAATRAIQDDRRGVTSLEYALMGSLIMLAIVVAVTTFTSAVNVMYGKIVTAM